MTDAVAVEFWGVRGGIPCPGAGNTVYGGDTACVEFRCGTRRVIFDAGSGIRNLGRRLSEHGRPVDMDLVVSHCHLDHLMGLPFFLPAYLPATTIRLWAGHCGPQPMLRDAIAQLMTPPLFPITPATFAATMIYRDFRAGARADLGDGITLSSAPLHHPGGATGYRVDAGGRSLGYFTDHEQGEDGPDPVLVALARGVDLLVVDASYTPEEMPHRRGWGHSSWREAVALADAAGAKRLALFHHDPAHDDATMSRIEAQAQRLRSATFAARDGQVVAL